MQPVARQTPARRIPAPLVALAGIAGDCPPPVPSPAAVAVSVPERRPDPGHGSIAVEVARRGIAVAALWYLSYRDRVQVALDAAERDYKGLQSGRDLLADWLERQGIDASVVELSGSVEIAPRLGTADLICDLVSSGATLAANHLKPVENLLDSEAVLAGQGVVNEALLTGECAPVAKAVGDAVVAGTIATDSGLRVEVTATGDRTTLAGIQKLVADAQASGSRAQRLADTMSACWANFARTGRPAAPRPSTSGATTRPPIRRAI